MSYLPSDPRKKTMVILVSIFGVLLILVAGLLVYNNYYGADEESASTDSAKTTDETASTTDDTDVIAPDGTTAPSATTKRSTGTSSTTGTTSTTTPALVFTPTATAQKVYEHINLCTSEQFIFAASPHANTAGTVDWTWIRWDGGTSGVSGTLTFDASGNPTSSITGYSMTISPDFDVNGWLAVRFTWPGGTYTSNHADFFYDASKVFSQVQC